MSLGKWSASLKINKEMVEYLLTEKNITMTDLSRQMGMNRCYVAQAVAQGNMSERTLRRISDALGVDMEVLALKDAEKEDPQSMDPDQIFGSSFEGSGIIVGPKCNKSGECFARDKDSGRCKALSALYPNDKPCPFQKAKKYKSEV